MKRILWLLAAAAITITACNKPQYIIPVDDDEEEENPNDQEGFKEKTFVVNVDIMKDVETSNWAAHPAAMPGKDILEFLDLTETEFYKGMGYCDDDAGATGISTQKDATILFGVADENNTENLKWIPKTAANYGHWWSKTGRMTYWQDSASDKYFYTESVVDWGNPSPDAETLADMWTYNIGFLDGGFDGAVGDVYKATEVFFITDEDDVELYAYVQWNIRIVEPAAVSLNVVSTQEISHSHGYIPSYGATSIQEEIDFDAIAAAIGISADEATVYAINSDGSVYPGAGTNFWFSIAGDVMSHGNGCGIDINKDVGYWTYCNYPDEALAGQILKGAIAFANPANSNAYVVKVTVNLGTQDTWPVAATVQVGGETVETYPDFSTIAAYLGFENVDGLYDALCDGSVYPVGVNADGSLFLGEDGKPAYSQAYDYYADWDTYVRGVFFSKEGTGSWWNTGEDNFYSTIYWYQDEGTKTIEVDITPFAVTEEDLGTYSYKWGFVKDDKMACLEMQITLESAVAWNTISVEGTTATVKMVPKGGYKGLAVTFDNAAIASALGTENLAAEIESGDIVVVGLNADGTVALDPNDNTKYWNSGENPYGHWFGADSNVCSWGSDARVCCNIKIEGTTVYTAMCQMDANGESACAVGDTYKVVQRFIKGEKTIDITYNISIVEAI